jgi:hypothetical protein
VPEVVQADRGQVELLDQSAEVDRDFPGGAGAEQESLTMQDRNDPASVNTAVVVRP